MKFIHKVPLAPSKCLSKFIKVDKLDYFQNGPQHFLSLLYIYIFFKYETIVRSSAWSFGHSDPDPSSVKYESTFLRKVVVLVLKVSSKNYIVFSCAHGKVLARVFKHTFTGSSCQDNRFILHLSCLPQ